MHQEVSSSSNNMREFCKICSVCGDRALGCNFNAITCESCKAFFRRNALKNKKLQCFFTGNCNITSVTRRFCQKCRLDKCFAIGMKKELILSEEDKNVKKLKIERNKTKKRPASEQECFNDKTTTSSVVSTSAIASYFCDSFEKFNNDIKSQATTSRPLKNCSKTLVTSKDSKLQNFLIDDRSVVSYDKPDVDIEKKFSSQIKSNSTKLKKFCTNDEEITSNKKFLEIFQQDSSLEFISNLLQNPNVVVKIIQNPKALAKIVMDSDIMNELINDPVILRQFEETFKNDRNKVKIIHETNEKSTVKNPISTQNCIKNKTKDIFEETQRESSSPDILDSIISKAINMEFSTPSISNNVSNRGLNDLERAKLNELLVANIVLLPPLEEDITNLSDDCDLKDDSKKKDPKLLGVINLTAIAIKRLIKMSKRINAFKNLCQEDQIALLKGGCTEMMMLRSAINYDPNKETWDIPHSRHKVANIKADVLKEANESLYVEHKKFIKTFDSSLRDENIILILCSIALFTPERPKVIHKDVIKLEQNSYYYLLKRYLESVYPACEAKLNFLRLLQKMSELKKLNEKVIDVYLNVSPFDIEPLLIEIFDLKV